MEEKSTNTKTFLGRVLLVILGIAGITVPWFLTIPLGSQIMVTIVGIVFLGMGFKEL